MRAACEAHSHHGCQWSAADAINLHKRRRCWPIRISVTRPRPLKRLPDRLSIEYDAMRPTINGPHKPHLKSPTTNACGGQCASAGVRVVGGRHRNVWEGSL